MTQYPCELAIGPAGADTAGKDRRTLERAICRCKLIGAVSENELKIIW